MKQIILPYVLANAASFNGKANPKVVLGMVLKNHSELKQDIATLNKEIDAAIKEVESLSLLQIQIKLKELAPQGITTQKVEEKVEGPLKPLPNAKKDNVLVRIAPSPSGPLHIGHAYGVSLNYEYAKMYHGKLFLRIEDTNAENIYPLAYELIERDAQWLTNTGLAQVIVQSDRLGLYYDYAEQLVQKCHAYVCTCDGDQWREMKAKGEACPCRSLPTSEQLLRYAKLFNEYAEGEAVLRLKTDIQHKNPAMRDFGIMRIVEHVHPKTKKEQRVWPLMVYSVAVDDHEMGITHVLNGKDHTDNAAKERIIMDCFGWKHPEYKHWGRINFEGYDLSTTKTKLAIEQGHYKGWDDIRLPFLPALRKRGFRPEAFRRFAIEIGLSLNDKTVSIEEFWKNIYAFNKEIVEPESNRYFFIDNPVRTKIEKFAGKQITIDLHPDFPKRGKRVFTIKQEVFLAKSDLEKINDNYLHRLMDCCNIQKSNNQFYYVSDSYEEYKDHPQKGLIIHWLPAEETIDAEVWMDDGSIVHGKAERALLYRKVGEVVQLERRYFACIQEIKDEKIVLWYLHK